MQFGYLLDIEYKNDVKEKNHRVFMFNTKTQLLSHNSQGSPVDCIK